MIDILLNDKVIDQKKAEEVKVSVMKTGRSEEQVLLDLGYASDKDIAKAKSVEFNIPFVDLDSLDISNELLNSVDANLLKTYRAVPVEDSGVSLKVAMIDPFDVPAIQSLQRAIGEQKRLFVSIAAPSQVSSFLDKRVGQAISSEVSQALEDVEKPVTDISDAVQDITMAQESLQNAPVARIVNSILQYGVKIGASDVHIEPSEEMVRVRYRVHGIMTEKLKLPRNVGPSIVARIKILAKLKIDEKRVPQDGRFPIKVGERVIDLRISTLPTVFGEKVVMRLLERTGGVPALETSGLRGTAYKTYIEGIKATTGIVIISGPTGSGKTRTLAGTISKLNKPEVNIVTIEDPVEIRIAGVNQVQINTDAGVTFANTLRAVLRQDPNIIMVGEIRDAETANLAVQAALTGHLVLTTIHTNSAASSLPRLIDMGIEPYLIASVLHMVVAQRLPRKICPNCKEAYLVSQDVIDNINKVLGSINQFDVVKYLLARCQSSAQNPGNEVNVKCPVDRGGGQHDIYLYRGKGCDQCENTGYVGRVGIFEVLKVTEQIGRMILENRSATEIEHVAVKEGMIKMIQDGYLKALEGITTIEEVLRVCSE